MQQISLMVTAVTEKAYSMSLIFLIGMGNPVAARIALHIQEIPGQIPTKNLSSN